jgi:hypothetical protein
MLTPIVGKRIRLIHTDDPYTLLKPSDEGEIVDITKLPESMGGHNQIWINWENGSRLALSEGIDSYEVL